MIWNKQIPVAKTTLPRRMSLNWSLGSKTPNFGSVVIETLETQTLHGNGFGAWYSHSVYKKSWFRTKVALQSVDYQNEYKLTRRRDFLKDRGPMKKWKANFSFLVMQSYENVHLWEKLYTVYSSTTPLSFVPYLAGHQGRAIWIGIPAEGNAASIINIYIPQIAAEIRCDKRISVIHRLCWKCRHWRRVMRSRDTFIISFIAMFAGVSHSAARRYFLRAVCEAYWGKETRTYY